MAFELFSNNGVSQLNGAVSPSDVAIIVLDGSVFPSSGNFRISVGSEIMIATARSGNTLTVSRAQESTTAGSHANNANVRHLLTKGGLDGYRGDFIIIDTFANRPSAGRPGTIFLASDNNYLEYDDGSNWQTYGPIFRFKQPNQGDFTWVNQGTAILLTDNGVLTIKTPNTSGVNLRILKKAVPTKPYTITGFFNYASIGNATCTCGLCWRESSTGKLVTAGFARASLTCAVEVGRFTNETTSTTLYKSQDIFGIPCTVGGMWVRLYEDLTNRKVYLSADGYNWYEFHSISRTDHLTADEVGICAQYINTTAGETYNNFYSYEEG